MVRLMLHWWQLTSLWQHGPGWHKCHSDGETNVTLMATDIIVTARFTVTQVWQWWRDCYTGGNWHPHDSMVQSDTSVTVMVRLMLQCTLMATDVIVTAKSRVTLVWQWWWDQCYTDGNWCHRDSKVQRETSVTVMVRLMLQWWHHRDRKVQSVSSVTTIVTAMLHESNWQWCESCTSDGDVTICTLV